MLLVREFTYYKAYKHNSNLRIDGYYYSEDVAKYGSIKNKWTSFVLYNDGTFLFIGASKQNHNKLETTLVKMKKSFKYKKYKWGAYVIKEDTINIQLLLSNGDSFIPFTLTYGVHNEWGRILNDTTIRIFMWKNRGEEKEKVNFIYNFYQCECKPDSDNWLKHHKRLNKYWDKVRAKEKEREK